MARLVVQLVTWNGSKYIPYLFDSLRKQTYKDWELHIFENGSSDSTLEEIQKGIVDFPVAVHLEQSEVNTGFAGGHNRLFQRAKNPANPAVAGRGAGKEPAYRTGRQRASETSEYVLLLNQDMYLMPDCLEKMVAFFDVHRGTAAVSPRLMRWDFSKEQRASLHPEFRPRGSKEQAIGPVGLTSEIDALGLKVFRSRRVIEWMTKQRWQEVQPELNKRDSSIRPTGSVGMTVVPVFGVSGAFPMYRRSALLDVSFDDGTFLDESYHSYKEDVDLAFRLRSRGYEAFVLLDTIAYHDRSGAGPREMDDASAARNKKLQSEWVRYHSYKNHLMTLYKNEYWQNILLDFPWIVWYEIKKFAWFLIFDRKVLSGLREMWEMRAQVKSQSASWRTKVKSLRKASWREMRNWWTKQHVRDEAFGIIPVHKEQGTWRFLMVRERRGDHWALPKGRAELGDETPIETAKRELMEELGIAADNIIENKSFVMDYVFPLKRRIVHKSAAFFIGFVSGDIQTTLQRAEIKDRVWLPIDDAIKLASHEQMREVLKQANQYLLTL